jgi:pimeloyl-ACP methyl ester carboxylesterase
MEMNDMPLLPPGMRSAFVDCGAVRLHAVTNAPQAGADSRPAILFLHGFPEYWAAWRPVFELLAADFLILAPDQRGYNLSDAPQETEAYATGRLVADATELVRQVLGQRDFIVAGHDWGASVAYAMAFAPPPGMRGLAIVNGVHPVCFQRAIVEDEGQRLASQYMRVLKRPDSAVLMSEDGFRRTFGMFDKFSATPWLTQAEREGYVRAWSRPGRMHAMLNWYRAAPMIVPEPGEKDIDAPLMKLPRERFMVSMPHVLVWGHADQALRPSATAGLEEFAPDLRRVDIPQGDHWVIHAHPHVVARAIAQFAGEVLGGKAMS